MNGKDLYFAVADIEEKWIEESEVKEKKHLNLKYIIPIAACIAIAAAVTARYNIVGTTINPQGGTENINGGYAVSEKATAGQTEEKNAVKNGATADSEKKDVPKTNPDAVNDGINLTDGGNGYYLSIADNGEAPTYKTVLFKADDSISGGRSDALVPKAGEVFISHGLSETMKNHAGEDVYYSVVLEMYGATSTSEELEKESDRLYRWCQENGYENCVFSTSKVTFPDGTTDCELRGEMVTAEFINNFPADDCGYLIRFPNERL